MSENRAALAARLFEGWDEDTPQTETWPALEEAGLDLLAVPEALGGSGGSLGEAADVLRAAGRHAVPLPLAETGLLAGWALAASGLQVPRGPLSAVPVHRTPNEEVTLRREGEGWSLSGRVRRVPWAREAKRLVVIGRAEDGIRVASVDPAACGMTLGENMAGEPRDDVVFDEARAAAGEVAEAGPGVGTEGLLLRGALARSVLMSGALERVLELSLRYATERRQFGRPIGRFQAVQQQLAVLAGEVAAADAAASAAVESVELKGIEEAAFEVAAAKVRVGEAAGVAAGISHQVHGAVGFTERHPLRHATLRLWSWREEFGSESEWAGYLGGVVLGRGPERLWPTVTTPSG